MSARSRTRTGFLRPARLARPEPLRWHALLAATAATTAVLLNLLGSPGRLWAPWLALALGAALAVHGAAVLARALRPPAADGAGARPRAADAPAARVAVTAADHDPGPPIFPEHPAPPARRWIPRAPVGPAPVPRVAAIPQARHWPRPDARFGGADVALADDAPAREPQAPPARPGADDGWAAARAALAGAPAGDRETAAAGW